ncbi:MAG: hypothetical protein H8E44_21220 [Planctomycetes bacterium]|nr:hypothetical protein [Planctomycetota bacterium]
MKTIVTGMVVLAAVVIEARAAEIEQPSQTPVVKIDPQGPHCWPRSVKTKDELRKKGLFPADWKWLEYDGMQIGIAVVDRPTDSESYIDVFGYIYNQSFKEWRHFLTADLRNAGDVKIDLDMKHGALKVVGAAKNDLNGRVLVLWDLAALSDDRAYVR